MAHLIQCGECTQQLTISDAVFESRMAGKKVALRCKHCGATIVHDDTARTEAQPAKPEATGAAPKGEAKPLANAVSGRAASPLTPLRRLTPEPRKPTPLPFPAVSPAASAGKPSDADPPKPAGALPAERAAAAPPRTVGRLGALSGKTILGLQQPHPVALAPPLTAPLEPEKPSAQPAAPTAAPAEPAVLAPVPAEQALPFTPVEQALEEALEEALVPPPSPPAETLAETEAATSPADDGGAEPPTVRVVAEPEPPAASAMAMAVAMPTSAVTAEIAAPGDRETATRSDEGGDVPAAVRKNDRRFGRVATAVLLLAGVLGVGVVVALERAPASADTPQPARAAESARERSREATPSEGAVVASTAPTAAELKGRAAPEQEATGPKPNAVPAGDDEIPPYVQKEVVLKLAEVAMRRATRCHLSGRPRGTADVIITIAPHGRVSAVKIEGEPIASAPVSTCIKEEMRTIVLRKFDGPEFSIRRQISFK